MITKLLLAHKNKIVLLTLLYTLVLTYLSLNTVEVNMKLPSQSDKLFHALAYFIYSIFWGISLYYKFKFPIKKTLITTALLSFLFGVFIELAQHFLTLSRQGDIADVFANLLGTLFAIIILNIFILKTVKS